MFFSIFDLPKAKGEDGEAGDNKEEQKNTVPGIKLNRQKSTTHKIMNKPLIIRTQPDGPTLKVDLASDPSSQFKINSKTGIGTVHYVQEFDVPYIDLRDIPLMSGLMYASSNKFSSNGHTTGYSAKVQHDFCTISLQLTHSAAAQPSKLKVTVSITAAYINNVHHNLGNLAYCSSISHRTAIAKAEGVLDSVVTTYSPPSLPSAKCDSKTAGLRAICSYFDLQPELVAAAFNQGAAYSTCKARKDTTERLVAAEDYFINCTLPELLESLTLTSRELIVTKGLTPKPDSTQVTEANSNTDSEHECILEF